ncbi:NAD(P)-binding protein [Tothia fuscella]|uniref:NAD(P)-binding protein n=1 Tax=Tothia fuscella TaxID=1048955 RepID=A0A9P4NUP3_9PEZI|nr:NAD(P)-binding protein [Tothia fuscella]
MASIAKTVVATGASSGLGFEAIKILLAQSQPYRFILGCRNTENVQTAYDGLGYDTDKHSVTLLPLELSDLRSVKKFSSQTLNKLGADKIDILMLNAAVVKNADEPGINGSKYNEQYIVNHLSQHYLLHLLREKLIESRTHIVVVSSGAIRMVSDVSTFDDMVKAQSGAQAESLYPATKFIQLLGAHWWRRQLQGKCRLVAVSPGLIPDTGIARHLPIFERNPEMMKDAKPIETGARSILEAFTRDDFPEDPEQIFLTSWGEWWPKDMYKLSVDKALQNKWSPTQEQVEKDELVD